MKKFVAILAAALCVSALAVPALAAKGKGEYGDVPLFKGGITVDGKLDAAYSKLGLKVELNGDYSENYKSDTTGFAYFLHDGTNLYVAMTIKNSHPFVLSKEKISTDIAWKETGMEFYVDWKGDGAAGKRWFLWPDGQYVPEGSNPKLTSYAATSDLDKQSYIIELAIPLADGAKTGSTIGWYVMCTSRKDPATPKQEFIAVPTIMNHVTGASKPAEWANMNLSDKEVKMPVETTAATKPAAGTGSSAATFDAAIIMAVVAAAAGAGVVVSKKKH